MIVNASAGVFAVLSIAGCVFDCLNKPDGRDGRVAAENEDSRAARGETQNLLDVARKADLAAYEDAVEEDTLFPHFKEHEMETAFLQYRFQHGFPRLYDRLKTVFLPLSCRLVGVLYVLTDLLSSGSHFSERANTERRMALAAMLLLAIPFWVCLRLFVTKASVSAANFHLYANTIVASLLLFMLVGGAVFVNYGAYYKTPNDWMLRAGVTGLVLAVPWLGEQPALSATMTSVIAAFATEIVSHLALQGAAYKCDCYGTLSTASSVFSFITGFLTHAAYWVITTTIACESHI